ncbi:MAG: hypothetical protein J5492_03585 [Oxalobacter sp.]|nr:hypothetical protein [Oxalobacter sp.]
MNWKISLIVTALLALTACSKTPTPVTETFSCNDGNRFTLTHTPRTLSPATLSWQGQTYEMTPVKTKTGAERFEHPSGITYIGAANTSMLIDRIKGKLIVQDCRNPTQEKAGLQQNKLLKP